MRKSITIGILFVIPAVIGLGTAVLSCSQLECAQGTHEENGKCVASVPNQCGPGTYSSGGQCIPLSGSPCGPNTRWDGDAGLCIGQGGGGDGGVASKGARWTHFKMIKPEAIASLANIQLPGYFADSTIVVILKADPVDSSQIWLHGGSGAKMSDDPLTYTFKDGFVPPMVLSALSAPVTVEGKSYTPFATAQSFEWTFKFLPGQPPLYMYKTSITGTLNSDGIPTSEDPPQTPGVDYTGVFKGCFTPTALEPGKYGAEDVYLEILGQNLQQLLVVNGAVLDADCTDSGSPNGYLLEAQWASRGEIADLVPETTQTDGGVPADAGTD